MSSENTHESEAGSSAYIGASVGSDGQLDLSRAARVELPSSGIVQEGRERLQPEASDQDELEKNAAESALDAVLNEAADHGFNESDLSGLVQGLYMDDKPLRQRFRLLHKIRQRALNMKPEQLHDLAKKYQKEKIRATEKGELLHYHQTALANFDEIVNQGALLSHNAQKELNIAGNAAGSRPDVVQFTRDHYDENGKLKKPGLVNSGGLGAAGEVAFIFDASIMDTPGYDGIVEYPNVPFAPLSKLEAVAVAKVENIPYVSARLAEKGLSPKVTLRSDWVEQQASRQPNFG